MAEEEEVLEEVKGKWRLETHANLDLEAQSRETGGGVRVSALLGPGAALVTTPDASVTTLHQLFRVGAQLSKGGAAVGCRQTEEDGSLGPYAWTSYDQLQTKSAHLAKALGDMAGLAAGQDSMVGIYMKNCVDWVMVEMAAYVHRRVIVPCYSTTVGENVAAIAAQTSMQVLFCDAADKLGGLLDFLDKCSRLKWVVLSVASEAAPARALLAKARVPASRLSVLTLAELLDRGAKSTKLLGETPPRPTDVSTISYTSGTEGETKGVILTHANLVAAASNVNTLHGVKITNKDICFSYLPLAHIYQRSVELMVFSRGGRVGYLSGKSSEIFQDMQALKPTIFSTVPRLLNELYDKVMKNHGDPLNRVVFAMLMKLKKKKMGDGFLSKTSWMDRMYLRKRQKQLGGELRLMVTGSAPINDEVVRFMRLLYGCVVVEGYGATETSGACTLTNEADPVFGHVGAPAPCAQIKLIDIPDMGISAIDSKGEILVKGPSVAVHYLSSHRNARPTPVTDAQGWFHTGDVGEWTDSGCLKVVDRVKNLFKLPQGCFIAPEKLEAAYAKSKYLEQIFVTGDPLKTSVVGVGVLDMEMLVLCAKEDFGLDLAQPLGDQDRVSVCHAATVRRTVLNELQKAGKAFGLLNYEMIKAIHLRPERFTVENGLLGPTGKLRRYELRRRFSAEIDEMFVELEEGALRDPKMAATLGSNKSSKGSAKGPHNKPARASVGRKDLL